MGSRNGGMLAGGEEWTEEKAWNTVTIGYRKTASDTKSDAAVKFDADWKLRSGPTFYGAASVISVTTYPSDGGGNRRFEMRRIVNREGMKPGQLSTDLITLTAGLQSNQFEQSPFLPNVVVFANVIQPWN